MAARRNLTRGSAIRPGEGNIAAHPLFVDPDGPDDDPTTWQDNDYRLLGGSPCIDAGNTTAIPPDWMDMDADGDTQEPSPYDLDRMPRIMDDAGTADTGLPGPPGMPAVVDMGAYEFQAVTLHGDLNNDGHVDIADYAIWQACLAGPEVSIETACAPTDLDADGDVDLEDGALIQTLQARG